MNAPLVYVIILNYNGRRWVEPCLYTLLQTNYENYCVLLVDNASTDGSAELAAGFAGVQVIVNPGNLGFSVGNNIGLRVALRNKTDYAVLLNSDTQVEPDWLRHLIAVGETESDLGILGAVQLEYDGSGFNSWTKTAAKAHLAELAEPERARQWIKMDWVEGACLAVKREVLEAVGLLDPIYGSFYEEIDLCRRATQRGFKIGLVPRSRVHHYRGGSWTADDATRRQRDYLCDRSQFIFAATDPARSLAGNLRWYLITLATKAKELMSSFTVTRLLDLARMQGSLLLAAGALLNKWRRERRLVKQEGQGWQQ